MQHCSHCASISVDRVREKGKGVGGGWGGGGELVIPCHGLCGEGSVGNAHAHPKTTC